MRSEEFCGIVRQPGQLLFRLPGDKLGRAVGKDVELQVGQRRFHASEGDMRSDSALVLCVGVLIEHALQLGKVGRHRVRALRHVRGTTDGVLGLPDQTLPPRFISRDLLAPLPRIGGLRCGRDASEDRAGGHPHRKIVQDAFRRHHGVRLHPRDAPQPCVKDIAQRLLQSLSHC